MNRGHRHRGKRPEGEKLPEPTNPFASGLGMAKLKEICEAAEEAQKEKIFKWLEPWMERTEKKIQKLEERIAYLEFPNIIEEEDEEEEDEVAELDDDDLDKELAERAEEFSNLKVEDDLERVGDTGK